MAERTVVIYSCDVCNMDIIDHDKYPIPMSVKLDLTYVEFDSPANHINITHSCRVCNKILTDFAVLLAAKQSNWVTRKVRG